MTSNLLDIEGECPEATPLDRCLINWTNKVGCLGAAGWTGSTGRSSTVAERRRVAQLAR